MVQMIRTQILVIWAIHDIQITGQIIIHPCSRRFSFVLLPSSLPLSILPLIARLENVGLAVLRLLLLDLGAVAALWPWLHVEQLLELFEADVLQALGAGVLQHVFDEHMFRCKGLVFEMEFNDGPDSAEHMLQGYEEIRSQIY